MNTSYQFPTQRRSAETGNGSRMSNAPHHGFNLKANTPLQAKAACPTDGEKTEEGTVQMKQEGAPSEDLDDDQVISRKENDEPHLTIERTDRTDATFVSNDTISFNATFWGCEDLAGACDAVQWTVHSVSTNSGNGNPHTGQGGEFSFVPNPTRRPTGGSRQPNDPIEYRVEATTEGVVAEFNLEQDERDILRQEYIDYNTTFRPTRAQVNAPTDPGFNTGNYTMIALEAGEMQTMWNGMQTNWATACANANVTNVPGIGLESAYRNPQRNRAVGSVTVNSRHTRGRAFDVVPTDGGFTQTEWKRLRQAGTDTAGSDLCICEDGPTENATCSTTGEHPTDHVHLQW